MIIKSIELEIYRIANQITGLLEKNEFGYSLKTIEPTTQGSYILTAQDNFYNGNAGILVLYTALYQYSANSEHLNIAKEIANSLIQNNLNEIKQPYSLFLGTSGLAFSLLKLYKITGEKEYYNAGVKLLTLSTSNAQAEEKQNCEFFTGLSGLLIVLLHFYAETQTDEILKQIDTITGLIMQNTLISAKGCFWGETFDSTNGLCGLSHGASGVSFALLEVGVFFNNKALIWLAEEGIKYEAFWYNKTETNSPDFRTPISDKNILDTYISARKKGNFSLFSTITPFNGWCNGAVGIGMVRLRAYEILGKIKYRNEAINSIQKTLETDLNAENPFHSFTLCHGTLGNVALFWQAYKVLGKKKYKKWVLKTCEKAIEHYQKQNYYSCGYGGYEKVEDFGLFNGIAGIAYFYLQVISPQLIDSILLPSIYSNYSKKKIKGNNINIDLMSLQKKILQKTYSQTYEAIMFFHKKKYLPSVDEIVFDTKGINLKKWVNNIDTQATDNCKNIILDIFKLEQKKSHCHLYKQNNVLTYVENKIIEEDILTIKSSINFSLTNTYFIINPRIIFVSTKWDWTHSAKHNVNKESSKHHLIIIPTATEILQFPLDNISHFIIHLFKKSTTGQHAFSKFLSHTDIDNTNKSNKYHTYFFEYVNWALMQGIIMRIPIYNILINS